MYIDILFGVLEQEKRHSNVTRVNLVNDPVLHLVECVVCVVCAVCEVCGGRLIEFGCSWWRTSRRVDSVNCGAAC